MQVAAGLGGPSRHHAWLLRAALPHSVLTWTEHGERPRDARRGTSEHSRGMLRVGAGTRGDARLLEGPMASTELDTCGRIPRTAETPSKGCQRRYAFLIPTVPMAAPPVERDQARKDAAAGLRSLKTHI